jgi:AcrR family transcriptional regulator
MGRTSLKEVRQKEILQAFYTVAKKIGLENASIAKVAEHLDINPSLVVHYFKTRDALLEELVHYTLEQYSNIYKTNGEQYSDVHELEQLIDNLFSRKWDKLFDDGVFYSCYALTYRNRKLRIVFRELHDSLRLYLVQALKKAKKNKVIAIKNEQETAEIIFALMEGGYYYLGMTDSAGEYAKRMNLLKKQACAILGLA